MFRKVTIFLLFLISYYCEATKVLTFFNNKDENNGFLTIRHKSTSGNGMAFCSWIKISALSRPSLRFIETVNDDDGELVFSSELDLQTPQILGRSGPKMDLIFSVVNSKNLGKVVPGEWFHYCVNFNKPTFSFYLNGTEEDDFLQNPDINVEKVNNLKVMIGDVGKSGGNVSFFEANLFNRKISADEAKKMFNNDFIEGDIVSWKDITSKSKDIEFGEKIKLDEDPSIGPKSEVVQSMNNEQDIGSNSGSSFPGSNSGSGDPGSSSNNPTSGASSDNSEPGSLLNGGQGGTSGSSGN